MNNSNILAHRGLWSNPADKNSYFALKAALDKGYGIETDIRSYDGELYISHDPLLAGVTYVKLKSILDYYSQIKSTARIALNVKSDGLHAMLVELLASSELLAKNSFVFDMSVPDLKVYLDHGISAYTRISEYEKVPSFIDSVSGVWVDNFSGVFDQVSLLSLLVRFACIGFRSCIVEISLIVGGYGN